MAPRLFMAPRSLASCMAQSPVVWLFLINGSVEQVEHLQILAFFYSAWVALSSGAIRCSPLSTTCVCSVLSGVVFTWATWVEHGTLEGHDFSLSWWLIQAWLRSWRFGNKHHKDIALLVKHSATSHQSVFIIHDTDSIYHSIIMNNSYNSITYNI